MSIAEPPDTTEIQQRTDDVVEQATILIVDSQDAYEEAGEFLRAVKTIQKRIADTFDEPVKKAHEAHKAMVVARQKHLAPLDRAEVVVKGKVGVWTAEQERIRHAEDVRRRKVAEEAEAEVRLAEAEALEAAGKSEAADAVIDAPVFVAPPPLPPPAKVAGLSTRKTWKFRVVGPAIVPREYMMVDEVKIGGVVRSMKDQTRILGIEVYCDDTVAVKAY